MRGNYGPTGLFLDGSLGAKTEAADTCYKANQHSPSRAGAEQLC